MAIDKVGQGNNLPSDIKTVVGPKPLLGLFSSLQAFVRVLFGAGDKNSTFWQNVDSQTLKITNKELLREYKNKKSNTSFSKGSELDEDGITEKDLVEYNLISLTLDRKNVDKFKEGLAQIEKKNPSNLYKFLKVLKFLFSKQNIPNDILEIIDAKIQSYENKQARNKKLKKIATATALCAATFGLGYLAYNKFIASPLVSNTSYESKLDILKQQPQCPAYDFASDLIKQSQQPMCELDGYNLQERINNYVVGPAVKTFNVLNTGADLVQKISTTIAFAPLRFVLGLKIL
ncbi:MAG: hypothetical protein JXA94_03590 [Parachlamydiales bacterium]|nr:hypothetical protein [Parachlamydiales bacterium]